VSSRPSGSFEVAWRSTASRSSAGVIPQPSSLTSTPSSPPLASAIEIRVAPASSAFSISSLSAEAGRSTTSPAAIWLTSPSGRRRIAGRAGGGGIGGAQVTAAPA
jgi:hypothetical protein